MRDAISPMATPLLQAMYFLYIYYTLLVCILNLLKKLYFYLCLFVSYLIKSRLQNIVFKKKKVKYSSKPVSIYRFKKLFV